MNRNPYEVLGLNEGASLDEVKAAYKSLARKYQSEDYSNGPLSSNAQKKMDEINEAYDAIISNKSGSSRTTNTKQQQYYTDNSNSSSYPDVRSLINRNKLEEAETILDGIYITERDAEWYYLKGQVHHRRGWFDEARKSYQKACELDPSNSEYSSALNSLNSGASGGYYTSHSGSGGDCCNCGACDICSSLMCADCCCECFGGDLIKCC